MEDINMFYSFDGVMEVITYKSFANVLQPTKMLAVKE